MFCICWTLLIISVSPDSSGRLTFRVCSASSFSSAIDLIPAFGNADGQFFWDARKRFGLVLMHSLYLLRLWNRRAFLCFDIWVTLELYWRAGSAKNNDGYIGKLGGITSLRPCNATCITSFTYAGSWQPFYSPYIFFWWTGGLRNAIQEKNRLCQKSAVKRMTKLERRWGK